MKQHIIHAYRMIVIAHFRNNDIKLSTAISRAWRNW